MEREISNYSIGWEYISAIFSYFRDIVSKKELNSHVAPKYIYRGISKRYFTESERLCIAIKAILEDSEIIIDNRDFTETIQPYWEIAEKRFKEHANEYPYNNKKKTN